MSDLNLFSIILKIVSDNKYSITDEIQKKLSSQMFLRIFLNFQWFLIEKSDRIHFTVFFDNFFVHMFQDRSFCVDRKFHVTSVVKCLRLKVQVFGIIRYLSPTDCMHSKVKTVPMFTLLRTINNLRESI